jgi:PAS domain S-box-containing protein
MRLAPRLYTQSVTLLGGVVLGVSVWHLVTAPPGVAWFILSAFTVISGAATLRMPVVPVSFSISDTFTIAAALLFGPAAGAITVALDSLAISRRLRPEHRSWSRVLFNATVPALSMWVAARTFFALAGVAPLVANPAGISEQVLPLAVFAGMYFLLNTGLVAAAITLDERGSLFAIWRRYLLGLWLTFFGGASFAALLIQLMGSRDANFGIVALLLPLPVIMYLGFKSTIDRMNDQLADLGRVNRMYQSIIQGAVYGILRTTTDGRFIDVNRAVVAMLGYHDASDLLAKNLWNDVLDDPLERTLMLSSAAGSAPIEGLEVWWRRNDGSRILVRASGRTVAGDQQQPSALELIVEDVTERRALEEQLRQAQKLDAIGRLARGVAHDFNNLLTVIVGSGELIAQQLPDEHPAQIEVRELLHGAHTAATLTRQLLAFSRQQPSLLEQVDVNDVIQEMGGLLNRLGGEQVDVDLDLTEELPRAVADRAQLEQVVMNLVINARDAMPDGGRLTIATYTANRDGDFVSSPTPRYVGIRVTDTGIGMPEEVQAHIFEPFFTTKENGKGSGLGLATVYGIVKQSGGEIHVASRPREGASFTICLPTEVPIGVRAATART